MNNDLLELKNSRQARMNSLQNKFSEKQQSTKDERFWVLDYDKTTKSGRAIIRPIGPAAGESEEFVAEHTHFIMRNNKILSVNCPTTTGQKCPICEDYWSKAKEDRESQFSRKTKYIMNILVEKDFQHPENDGKIFLYRCPVTIFNKIKEALDNKDEMGQSKEPINVFDMWEGARINLVAKDKNGWLNYEASKIGSKSPIYEDTNNVELYDTIYKKLYKLKEFKVSPTYDEVKVEYDRLMSNIDTSTKNIDNHIQKETKQVFSEDLEEDDEMFKGTTVTNDPEIVAEDDFFNGLV